MTPVQVQASILALRAGALSRGSAAAAAAP